MANYSRNKKTVFLRELHCKGNRRKMELGEVRKYRRNSRKVRKVGKRGKRED